MNTKRSTTSEFIEKSILIHGNKYDYSLANYINNKTKLTIICNIHGSFQQSPNAHLAGNNCPLCSDINNALSRTKSHNKFVSELALIHPNLTILGEYVNCYTKILIKDENDIEYLVTPNNLLYTKGKNVKSVVDKNSLVTLAKKA